MALHIGDQVEELPLGAGKDRLLEHRYDGIQEYDNPTPGWWHWLFWASIVFSVVYVMFWHASDFAWTVHDAHDREIAAYYKKVFAGVGELKADEPTMLKLMHSPQADIANLKLVARGTFGSKCAACHGAAASGGTGPNLTDDSYLNVKALTDIASVIRDGAKAGSMPSWKGRLTDNEITLMASYVASLRGMNVPGKVAEGEVIAPWPAYTPPTTPPPPPPPSGPAAVAH